MSMPSLIAVLLCFVSLVIHADEDACRTILDASIATGAGAQKKMSGYDFTKDTPALYGFGQHRCEYLHDEVTQNEATAVYREQYWGSAGYTNATIWVSRLSGRLLREEQDGDIRGKGKGHISYRWPQP